MNKLKPLKIETSMLFDSAFAKNAFLSCFLFFLLNIDLYLLFPAVVAQILLLLQNL